MKVSVIIPVYNAEKYVRQAVESALEQPETGEVLLVEDNSQDNSLHICRKLSKENTNVRLLQHKGALNKGAGASRNLGILNSKYNYISFLDADDFYLPDRFKPSKELFEKNADIDGVYGLAGYHFETETDKKQYKNISPLKGPLISYSPGNLFENIIKGNTPPWHTGTITIKSNSFKKTGYFNEQMRLHQDTEMWIRMSATLNLIKSPSNKPCALVRRHRKNRFNPNDQPPRWSNLWIIKRCTLLSNLSDWTLEYNVKRQVRVKIIKRLMYFLGALHHFEDAWGIACRQKEKVLFLYALPFLLPGSNKIKFRSLYYFYINKILDQSVLLHFKIVFDHKCYRILLDDLRGAIC